MKSTEARSRAKVLPKGVTSKLVQFEPNFVIVKVSN